MDFIRGYSSEESDTEVGNTDTRGFNQKNSKGIDSKGIEKSNNGTSTDKNHNTSNTQTSTNYQTKLVNPLHNIQIYSKNYANQLDMSSCYLSIIWRPSAPKLAQLNRITDTILSHLKAHHNSFYTKYKWEIIGAKIPRHISLTENFRVPNSLLKEFHSNLANGLQFMPIPHNLIKSEDNIVQAANALNKAFGTQVFTRPSNFVSLKFQPQISLHRSNTSACLFFVAHIDMTADTEEFFKELEYLIKENCELIDIVPETLSFPYHISLIKTDEIDVEDIDAINTTLAEVDFSDLALIDINVDTIVIDYLGVTKESDTLRLPLDLI